MIPRPDQSAGGGAGRVVGKVALVTGGARGIGAAVVRRLAAEGASVLLTDILAEQGEELATELGHRVAFASHDVTSAEDWDRALAVAEESFGAPSSA